MKHLHIAYNPLELKHIKSTKENKQQYTINMDIEFQKSIEATMKTLQTERNRLHSLLDDLKTVLIMNYVKKQIVDQEMKGNKQIDV